MERRKSRVSRNAGQISFWGEEEAPQREEGRFGMRWEPVVDLLDVPDVSGVYVLFFSDNRHLIGTAQNLFRKIRQHRHAPGRRFFAFSWKEVPEEDLNNTWRKLNRKSYHQLWDGF